MAWPPPTPAGADPLHQYLAEYQQQQQQQQQHTNMNNQLSASTHAPTTDLGIQSEHASNAPFQTPQVTAMGFQLPQQQASSHSPAGNGVSGQRQSPQRHQQAGGSGGLAPSKSTLETRRSLQARGQNYHFGSGGPQGREWEERQRRDEAMSILESEEMVMWIAGVRNESIPQTRAHYRNIVLGLTQWEHADVAWLDEWEVQQGMGGGASAEGRGMTGGSPARSVKGKERDIAKMRKRVSSGQGHG